MKIIFSFLISVLFFSFNVSANNDYRPVQVLSGADYNNPEKYKAFHCQGYLTRLGVQVGFNKCMGYPEVKKALTFTPLLNGKEDLGKQYVFRDKVVSVEKLNINGEDVQNGYLIVNDFK